MSFIKTLKAIESGGHGDQLVTPTITKWLGMNQNWSYTTEDLELVESILADDSNSIRHGRFGASSRGTCLRRQVFAFLGMKGNLSFDPILFNVFADGHYRHLRWQIMGIKAGVFTHVEVPAKRKKLRLSVSVDALNEDDEWLFELKGAFKVPTEVPHDHLLQIHTYFYVTGYEVCSYVAEHKSSQNWKEFVVKKDPKIMHEVVVEIAALNEAIDDNKLPAILPECKAKKGAYKTCPYRKDCLAQGESFPQESRWDNRND